MELGATVCLPRTPLCPACPVQPFCAGRAAGRERELPVKLRKPAVTEIALDLLAILRGGQVFLVRRDDAEKRLAGFWELPAKDLFTEIRADHASEFTHRIVNDRFRVVIWRATVPTAAKLEGGRWFDLPEVDSVPVTTVTRKALASLSAGLSEKKPVKIRSRHLRSRVLNSDLS